MASFSGSNRGRRRTSPKDRQHVGKVFAQTGHHRRPRRHADTRFNQGGPAFQIIIKPVAGQRGGAAASHDGAGQPGQPHLVGGFQAVSRFGCGRRRGRAGVRDFPETTPSCRCPGRRGSARECECPGAAGSAVGQPCPPARPPVRPGANITAPAMMANAAAVLMGECLFILAGGRCIRRAGVAGGGATVSICATTRLDAVNV